MKDHVNIGTQEKDTREEDKIIRVKRADVASAIEGMQGNTPTAIFVDEVVDTDSGEFKIDFNMEHANIMQHWGLKKRTRFCELHNEGYSKEHSFEMVEYHNGVNPTELPRGDFGVVNV